METEVQISFLHGWGFDHRCWVLWDQLLPRKFDLQYFDRGYTEDPRSADLPAGGALQAVFTHSYGLHMVESERLAAADLLVIFGGFREFHPVAAQFKRRSKLVIHNMLEQLQEKPAKVMSEFMKNCYKPEEVPHEVDPEQYDIEKLYHDLEQLNQAKLDIEPLHEVGKICILHGASDAIVPRIKGRELFDIFKQKASYLEVKGAGHALPFTHASQCWAFIQPELQELRQPKPGV